ncbi:MAG: damage-inducible protein J [Oscillospiraceae bacterium]|nr:damage-inducible protein J [Oscillospiraceae bacterium]
MSTKTNLTIKLEKDVRDEFGILCNQIGITMASALNAFIKQAIRQQEMSFSLRDSNGFLPEEADELKRRIAGMRVGRLEAHDLIEED